MKTLLLVLALLVGFPVSSSAAWAFVQSDGNYATGTTVAKAFTSNVTAGNLVVAAVGWNCNSGETISSVSGSSTGALTQAGSTVTVSAGGTTNYCLALYRKANAAGGADTITATLSASTAKTLIIAEYSGIATSSELDQTAGNPQTDPGSGANAITSGSVTTTANNELILGVSFQIPDDSYAPGTGFTERQEAGDALFQKMALEDKNLASAGSTAATFTGGGFSANDTATIIATFKEPSSAPTLRNLMLGGVGR